VHGKKLLLCMYIKGAIMPLWATIDQFSFPVISQNCLNSLFMMFRITLI
jgi:hypothetical protein